MRTINITFTIEEFEGLAKKKGKGLTWHDFMLRLAEKTEGFAVMEVVEKAGAKAGNKK